MKEISVLSEKVRVHAISALADIVLDELKQYLTTGKTIVLLGSSGVGKSTLLNALAGTEKMKTAQIREKDAKGRHTTSHRQLFELENGVTIIDTPGMRELGVCDVDEGMDDTFSDITELISQCRFSDCRHQSEPGCAVKQALDERRLSQERWVMYMDLHRESKKIANMKKIAKKRRQINNGKIE